MQAQKSVYYFDFLFHVINPRTNKIVGVDVLTQAGSDKYGRGARRGATAYGVERENETGLKWRLQTWETSGSMEWTIAKAVSMYGIYM
jgi:hypothetical protein